MFIESITAKYIYIYIMCVFCFFWCNNSLTQFFGWSHLTSSQHCIQPETFFSIHFLLEPRTSMVHGRIFCKSSALERKIVMMMMVMMMMMMMTTTTMMMMMNDEWWSLYIYMVILSCCKCAYQFCLSTFPTEWSCTTALIIIQSLEVSSLLVSNYWGDCDSPNTWGGGTLTWLIWLRFACVCPTVYVFFWTYGIGVQSEVNMSLHSPDLLVYHVHKFKRSWIQNLEFANFWSPFLTKELVGTPSGAFVLNQNSMGPLLRKRRHASLN